MYGVTKGVDERIDEVFDHMEKEWIAKRFYVGECAGSNIQWVGRGRDGLIP